MMEEALRIYNKKESVGLFSSFEAGCQYSKLHNVDLLVLPVSEDARGLVGFAGKKHIETATDKKVKRKKMWVTIVDDKTCDSCKQMNGQIVDEDDYFEFNGYKLATPPLHWLTYTKLKNGKYGYKAVKNGAKDKITCRCGIFYFTTKIR